MRIFNDPHNRDVAKSSAMLIGDGVIDSHPPHEALKFPPIGVVNEYHSSVATMAAREVAVTDCVLESLEKRLPGRRKYVVRRGLTLFVYDNARYGYEIHLGKFIEVLPQNCQAHMLLHVQSRRTSYVGRCMNLGSDWQSMHRFQRAPKSNQLIVEISPPALMHRYSGK